MKDMRRRIAWVLVLVLLMTQCALGETITSNLSGGFLLTYNSSGDPEDAGGITATFGGVSLRNVNDAGTATYTDWYHTDYPELVISYTRPSDATESDTYTLTIALPQQLYFTTTDISGYETSFEKNANVSGLYRAVRSIEAFTDSGDNAYTYNINQYSGTLSATIAHTTETATLTVPIGYDLGLWSYAYGGLIADAPIQVTLSRDSDSAVISALRLDGAYASTQIDSATGFSGNTGISTAQFATVNTHK